MENGTGEGHCRISGAYAAPHHLHLDALSVCVSAHSSDVTALIPTLLCDVTGELVHISEVSFTY